MQRLFSGELFLLFCKNSPKYQQNGVLIASDETKTMLKPCATPSVNLPVKSTYSSSTVSKQNLMNKQKIEAATPTIFSAFQFEIVF